MSDPTSAPVSVETDGQVTTIRFDDGKANAVSHAVMDDLNAALDRAEAAGGAVLLLGRPGRFSAGFDLSVMKDGPDAARQMVRRGAELALRLYELPLPVVAGCTGHALAMGAIMLMASDIRIGAAGDFKIGLTEVAIGMPVPIFATELARDRLSPLQFTRAVSTAAVYAPDEAVLAGYLDEVVPAEDVAAVASERATALAEGLNPTAFRATRVNARGATLQRIRATLDADIDTFEVFGDPRG